MVTPEILRKYRGKSIKYLTEKAQETVNRFVRKRDSINGFFICISCQELKPINQMNAGHYYPKEFYKSVRYDLNNVNGQCVRCNKYLRGNLIEYRKNLLVKIGEENLKQLDKLAELKNFRFTREFLIELIEKSVTEELNNTVYHNGDGIHEMEKKESEEKSAEEKKALVKAIKEKVKEGATILGDPYFTVSFDSYDAKVEFLEFLGFNPEDKFIKGEELQEKTAEAYASE